MQCLPTFIHLSNILLHVCILAVFVSLYSSRASASSPPAGSPDSIELPLTDCGQLLSAALGTSFGYGHNLHGVL